jgi:inactive STAND
MSQLPDDFDPQLPDANPIKQADSYINKNAVQGNENSTVQGNKNQAILGNSNTVFYGNNNQIQFVFPITKKLQQQQPERQIPSLLPYLVNRSKQEYELEKGIKKLVEKAPISPLICIIHGDEFQSHDKFLERLHKVSLPKFLGQDSIKQYHLPSPPKLKNSHEFSDYLRNKLADIVIQRSSASLEEINAFFNECTIPILIHTHLLTEQLQKQEFSTLHNLLNFWHTWPIQIEQNLIICIFIKYQIKRKNQTKNSDIISLFFSFVNYFFKQYRYQRVNQKIYQHIETLSLSNFEKFNRLSGLVLPELTGVNRGEVEDWVRMEYTQNVIGEAMADKLIKEIRELFHKWEEQNSSNTIPMDDLADNLIKLLKSNLSGEGEIT